MVYTDQKIPPTSRRSTLFRRAGLVGVIALILGGVAYAFWPLFFEDWVILEKPAPAIVRGNSVDINGIISNENLRFELFVNDAFYPLQSKDLQGEGNLFRIANVKLAPGRNKIEVRVTRNRFGRKLQASDAMFVVRESYTPRVPAFRETAATINKLPAIFWGTTDPGADVELTVDGVRGQGVVADQYGQFSCRIEYLRPGDHQLVARARSSVGGLSSSSQAVAVKIDFDAIESRTLPVTRRLIATVSFKKLSLGFEVVLPKTDPRAAALITGESQLPEFLDRTFGKVHITGFEFTQLFLNTFPQIKTDGDLITIRGVSNPGNQISLPSLNGVLYFNSSSPTRSFDYTPAFFQGQGDSFEINIKDYQAAWFNPQPQWGDDQTAKWRGGVAEANDSPQAVAIGLRYRPFASFANFSRFIQQGPYGLIPYPATIVPAMLYGVLLIIPIAWAAWILKGFPATARLLRQPKKLLALYMGSLCFVSPIADLVTEMSGTSPSGHWFVLASLIFTVLVALAFLMVMALGNSKFVYLSNRTLRGMLGSSILIFLVVSTLWIAIRYFGGGYRSMATIIGVILVTPLVLIPGLLWGKPTSELQRVSSDKPGFRKKYLLLLIPLVGLWLLVAYPLSGELNNTFWSYRPDLTEYTAIYFSLFKFSHLFSYLQDVVGYVFLFGLLLALRRVSGTAGAEASSLERFDKFLFVAYLVGPLYTLFLIPIPFLLAFLAYRWVMPKAQRVEINELSARVFAERREKNVGERIMTFIDEPIQDSLEGLRKKFRGGEISLADLRKRQAEVKAITETDEAYNRGDRLQKLLALGPYESDWANGLHAVRYAIIPAFFMGLFYVYLAIVSQSSFGPGRYVPLWIAMRAISGVADWLVLAFFFGYFFKYIKGNSGLRKGVFLVAAYTFCFLPLWLIESSASFDTLIYYSLLNFIFPPLLGLLAFDIFNFRQMVGPRYSWRKLVQFADIPAVLAFSTFPISGIVVTIISLLTGQYKDIFSAVTNLAQQATPGTK